MTEDAVDDLRPTTFTRRKRGHFVPVAGRQRVSSGPEDGLCGVGTCSAFQPSTKNRKREREREAFVGIERMPGMKEKAVASVALIDSKRRQSSQAPSTSTGLRKRVLTQMHLDFGQKNFHSTQCPVCDFVYTPGKRDEERLHDSHHEKAVGRQIIKFRTMAPPGSMLVAKDGTTGGCIYVIRGRSHPSSGERLGRGGGVPAKTLSEVSNMLERELGTCDGWVSEGVRGNGVEMYMYVNGSKELAGCVVVEVDQVQAEVGVILGADGKVKKLSDGKCERDGNGCRKDDGKYGDRGASRSKKKKQCGVRVMWASKLHRRKRVVSALLDCVRGKLVPGQIIGRHDVAYSQPTRDGALFIASYSGRDPVIGVDTVCGSDPPASPQGTEFWVY